METYPLTLASKTQAGQASPRLAWYTPPSTSPDLTIGANESLRSIQYSSSTLLLTFQSLSAPDDTQIFYLRCGLDILGKPFPILYIFQYTLSYCFLQWINPRRERCPPPSNVFQPSLLILFLRLPRPLFLDRREYILPNQSPRIVAYQAQQ